MEKNLDEFHELHLGDESYKTKLTKKYANRRAWEYPDVKKMMSYIPGTIIELYVEEGAEVKEGEPVLLFEAMKMQTKMYMPYDGKVMKFCVAVGDRFPKEHVLVEIE